LFHFPFLSCDSPPIHVRTGWPVCGSLPWWPKIRGDSDQFNALKEYSEVQFLNIFRLAPLWIYKFMTHNLWVIFMSIFVQRCKVFVSQHTLLVQKFQQSFQEGPFLDQWLLSFWLQHHLKNKINGARESDFLSKRQNVWRDVLTSVW